MISLIQNGGFENWPNPAAPPADWIVDAGVIGTDIARSASPIYQGIYSLGFVSTTLAPAIQQQFTALPNSGILFSIFYLATSALDSLVFSVIDSMGTVIGTVTQGLTVNGSVWQQSTAYFQMPSSLPNGTYIKVATSGPLHGEVFLDNLRLECWPVDYSVSVANTIVAQLNANILPVYPSCPTVRMQDIDKVTQYLSKPFICVIPVGPVRTADPSWGTNRRTGRGYPTVVALVMDAVPNASDGKGNFTQTELAPTPTQFQLWVDEIFNLQRLVGDGSSDFGVQEVGYVLQENGGLLIDKEHPAAQLVQIQQTLISWGRFPRFSKYSQN
jgi:hypothetical protein